MPTSGILTGETGDDMERDLPTEVTLAAQKPLVLPTTDRARLRVLPHTIALKVVPTRHLITCGTENLQSSQHLVGGQE